MLDLVRTSKNPSGEWSADDYDVFDGKAQVGRITLTSQAPPGTPWFWVITARDPDSTQNRGYRGEPRAGDKGIQRALAQSVAVLGDRSQIISSRRISR